VNFFLAKIFQRQIFKDSSKDNVYTTILLARNGSQAPPPKKKTNLHRNKKHNCDNVILTVASHLLRKIEGLLSELILGQWPVLTATC